MTRYSFLMLCAIFCFSGCELRSSKARPVDFSYFTAPHATEYTRVGIIPFYLNSDVGDSAKAIDNAMTAAVRELGVYEVTTISQEIRDELFGSSVPALSAIDPFTLREIRQRTHVDAIIIGHVQQYDGYDPISIGIECHMVSCTDAQSVWSASGHFDGRRRDIQDDMRKWHYYATGKGNQSIGGWELALHTPELFCRYVSDRLAASVLY